MLQTNANNEYEAREGRPELPTGKLIEIQPKHNFNEARSVHKDQDAAGPLEVVLTGYQNGVEATLIREGDLRIKSKASGDYDGFLLCNKGTDNLMLEPIVKHPNVINVNQANAYLPSGENPGRLSYELSIEA